MNFPNGKFVLNSLAKMQFTHRDRLVIEYFCMAELLLSLQ